MIQRSIYTRKEADPHSWAIPRLTGRAKAALVEVQSDEYGAGRPDRIHAEIFARTMRGLGLDDSYGAYIDNVPAITLASFTMMSMFGLNRRLRGAIVGHLAAFEMTSSIPNRLYGNGFRRLGYGEDVTWYYDEHVEADAVHEQIAGRDLAGGLAEQHPELLADIVFGAKACLYVDGLAGAHMLERWEAGAQLAARSPVGCRRDRRHADAAAHRRLHRRAAAGARARRPDDSDGRLDRADTAEPSRCAGAASRPSSRSATAATSGALPHRAAARGVNLRVAQIRQHAYGRAHFA